MKLLVINLSGNIPKKIPLSGDTSLLLVTNGLDQKESTAANTLFTACAAQVPVTRLEFSKEMKPGFVANNAITLALNDELVNYVCYADKTEDIKKLGPMIGAIQGSRLFAVGTHKEIAPITLNVQYKVTSDEAGREIPLNGTTGKTEFTIDTPFVMDAKVFRTMMRSVQAFNIVNDGFQRAFTNDVNFPLLFVSIHIAAREVFKANSVLASI